MYMCQLLDSYRVMAAVDRYVHIHMYYYRIAIAAITMYTTCVYIIMQKIWPGIS